LVVTAVLLVVGIVGNAAFQMGNDPFRASTAQFVATVVLAALAAVVGLRLPRRADLPGAVPAAMGDRADRAGGGRAGRARPVVVRGCGGAGGAVGRSRRARRPVERPRDLDTAAHPRRGGRRARHVRVARVPGDPRRAGAGAVDLIGNAVFALGAVLLITMAWRRTAAASTIDTSSDISS
jgi:hypothetical protein